MTESIFGVNYTGPYISNGEVQTSVEFGDKEPKNELDKLSRLHDSAYAHWTDLQHREMADIIYEEEAEKIGRGLVGAIPRVGNAVMAAVDMTSDFDKYGPFALLYNFGKFFYNSMDLVLNENKYRNEVLEYYKTDPHPEFQIGYVKQQETKNYCPDCLIDITKISKPQKKSTAPAKQRAVEPATPSMEMLGRDPTQPVWYRRNGRKRRKHREYSL